MTTLQEHVESWLRDGHGYEQILRCANRMLTPDEEDIVQSEELRRIVAKRRAVDEADGFAAIGGE